MTKKHLMLILLMPFILLTSLCSVAYAAEPVSNCCTGMTPKPTPSCYGIQTGWWSRFTIHNLTSKTYTFVFNTGTKLVVPPSGGGQFQLPPVEFSNKYLNGNIDGTYVLYDDQNKQIAHGYINLINGRSNGDDPKASSWCKEDVKGLWCNDNGYQAVCQLDAEPPFAHFMGATTTIIIEDLNRA